MPHSLSFLFWGDFFYLPAHRTPFPSCLFLGREGRESTFPCRKSTGHAGPWSQILHLGAPLLPKGWWYFLKAGWREVGRSRSSRSFLGFPKSFLWVFLNESLASSSNLFASWQGFPFGCLTNPPYTTNGWQMFHDMRKPPGLRWWNRLPRYLTPSEKNNLAAHRSRGKKGPTQPFPIWRDVSRINPGPMRSCGKKNVNCNWQPLESITFRPALPSALRLPKCRKFRKTFSDPFQNEIIFFHDLYVYIYIYIYIPHASV